MSYIRYKNNNLFVESVSVRRLASKFKTPFYLYSESNIIENYKSFLNNFKKSKPLICFSVKANSNIQILKDKRRERPQASEVNRLFACNKKAEKLLMWKLGYQKIHLA